jgi:polyphenol oxidase
VDLITSPLLAAIPWLEHGFGTRREPSSQAGMASLKQIHSAVSMIADRKEGCIGEGDALITAQPGVAISVRTADCFPILLADLHHHVVASVHAGWRGTAARVVIRTLQQMSNEFDTRPSDVVAAIGPGIGACCYQVGAEVAERFGKVGPGALDLESENLLQLTGAGVPRAQISASGACTFCNPAQFYSYRRERETAGRMISYIRLLG